MKIKIKQLACMAVAFVTSFLVTVTAYASTDADTFDFYVGTYYVEKPDSNGDGNVKVREDSYFSLFAYIDFNNMCFVSGSKGEGIISQVDGFKVKFPYVVKCKKDGTLPANPGKILEYDATGKVTKGFVRAEILSDQSGKTYIRK